MKIFYLFFYLALTDEWRSVSIGTETNAVVTGLEPATRYHFRVLAENEIGTGEASTHISVRTDGEAPAGAPQNVQIIPIAPRQLQVTWSAPPPHLCYGSLLGYYIGFRELGYVIIVSSRTVEIKPGYFC